MSKFLEKYNEFMNNLINESFAKFKLPKKIKPIKKVKIPKVMKPAKAIKIVNKKKPIKALKPIKSIKA